MKKPIAKISREALERLQTRIAALPPKEKTQHSARDALALMEAVIRDTLAKGYSVQDIAEMLAEEGLRLSAGTIAGYLRELEDKSAPKKKAGVRKASQPAVSGKTAVAMVPLASPTIEVRKEVECAPKEQDEDEYLIDKFCPTDLR